ncbi:MAG: pyridoxal-dependent decarboxylase [Acidimicrobiales bacterium]
MSDYPYADRFTIHHALPEQGTSREDVLAELHTMATEEDSFWETGKCSGTMYCGDHDHYRFMNEAFGLFAHVNVLQRDMCPSATKFEAEIIAMTLGLHSGDAAVAAGDDPCGLVTTGGTGSILHAILAYREHAAQERGVTRPNVIKPETAHPAFDKACHLFGVELRRAPVDPVTTQVDVDWVRDHTDDQTVALIGSACNYGYGTVDPISDLSDLALERGIGLHIDSCLGGFILPFGRELGYDIPAFDYSVPGVTSMSADTHKYGYAFKGSSVVSFRSKALRNAQYFYLTDWSGGKYTSPGMEGSRSGGLIAATWASMVPRAPPRRAADLPLLLHLRRVRRLPRERLHADEGMALQRAAVPQRAPHGGDQAADPAPGGGGVHGRPGGCGGLRQGARRRGAEERGHLRRRGRRHDRRGG